MTSAFDCVIADIPVVSFVYLSYLPSSGNRYPSSHFPLSDFHGLSFAHVNAYPAVRARACVCVCTLHVRFCECLYVFVCACVPSWDVQSVIRAACSCLSACSPSTRPFTGPTLCLTALTAPAIFAKVDGNASHDMKRGVSLLLPLPLPHPPPTLPIHAPAVCV